MTLITPSRASGLVYGPTGVSVNFGWLTDTHWNPIKAMDNAKYYMDAVKKVNASVAAFNARNDLSFVFQNGDWIDGSETTAAALVDLQTITDCINGCKYPRYHNVGNHETVHLYKPQIFAITGQPSKWYSFAYGGVTFIVLDGNFYADADYADITPDIVDSRRSPYISYVPPAQRQWLENTIVASPNPCLIMCHYPMFYDGSAGAWALTNAAAVRTILEAHSSKVIGCLCGHLHDNVCKVVNGLPYITTDAVSTNPYPAIQHSIVSVYPASKSIKVIGTGTSLSYIPPV